MAQPPSPAAVTRLVTHLEADALAPELSPELTAWLAGSARFRSFVEQHRDKVRKKLRTAADPESRRDVRAELRAAHLLLGDRRLELAFEAYGAAGGPDFTITFRGGQRLNLEVSRLRGDPAAADLVGRLSAKLRQLPPSVANALLLAVDGSDAADVDVAGTVRALRTRADAKDEAFIAARGFAGTRDFYERFLRLGAVLTWCESAGGDGRAALWTNRSARIPFPPRAATAVLDLLRAG
jgi:hypothetical protein